MGATLQQEEVLGGSLQGVVPGVRPPLGVVTLLAVARAVSLRGGWPPEGVWKQGVD